MGFADCLIARKDIRDEAQYEPERQADIGRLQPAQPFQRAQEDGDLVHEGADRRRRRDGGCKQDQRHQPQG
ncbi:hypothetical protein D3C71_1923020 [compost metagenome]